MHTVLIVLLPLFQYHSINESTFFTPGMISWSWQQQQKQPIYTHIIWACASWHSPLKKQKVLLEVSSAAIMPLVIASSFRVPARVLPISSVTYTISILKCKTIKFNLWVHVFVFHFIKHIFCCHELLYNRRLWQGCSFNIWNLIQHKLWVPPMNLVVLKVAAHIQFVQEFLQIAHIQNPHRLSSTLSVAFFDHQLHKKEVMDCYKNKII